MNKTIIEMLIESGYPEAEMYHHESDLYIFVTPLTTYILERWCEANGWNKKLVKENSFVFRKFKDQVTGRPMYDVAFQYVPFWTKRRI